MGKTVRSSFQYLSISYECSLAIGNSLNLSEMLYEVIHTVVHKTNAHRGIIWVKNGDKKLQPVASAGINIENMPAQSEIMDLRDVLNQIQKKQQFVLRYKEDNDFLQYCPVLTGKEESVLIVPVTNIAILYLVYASREITDEPLANLLASLSKKLSVAIEACTAHGNVIKEIQVREKAEKELTKKTEQLISSKKNIQRLYGESEQARKLLLSILEDVAQKEEALRNSEEKLIQAVEGNSIPTFIIDNNHFITHWNKACESLTGISAAEIVGTRKAWSAFYAEERPLLADLIVDEATEKEIAGYYEGKYNKSILTEGAYECEDFFPAMGKKGKWLFFTASPLKNSQGTLIGAIETFQDITGRRSVEGQLRQSHKMEAIGTLAGGVAHDFNNLLTVIIGNAQLALMDAGKNGPLYEEIKEIKQAGERAVSVTRQLLAFSRKQIIKPEILDINEEINETGKMLQRLIREDIEFLTVLEPELWKVYADPMQINQVLMNMVVNARDAMPGGGKLTIETANMELDNIYFQDRGVESALSGSYVMLAVTDNGTGMDEKTRSRVFDPFFTTKEKVGGTGMGLSTVYGIVKQNNGYVWVYSEPGKGTSFKVYFPKVAEDVTAGKERAKVSDEISGSETVLIVEDNDALRKLAKNALRKYGYKILEAENGEKALNVSETHEGPIHLLLTDVVMPRMSGTDLSEKLQSIRPETRVIYMSGYTADAIVRNGILRQDINFIEKPFSLESLGKKVRQVLDNIK